MKKIIIGIVAFIFTLGPTLAHAAFTSTEPVDTVKTEVKPVDDVSTTVPKPTGDVTKEAVKPAGDVKTEETKTDDTAKAAKDKDVAEVDDVGCTATETAE